MPGTDPAPSTPRAPARAWLRPVLLLVGGALLTLLMMLADQLIAAIAIGAFLIHDAVALARVRELCGDGLGCGVRQFGDHARAFRAYGRRQARPSFDSMRSAEAGPQVPAAYSSGRPVAAQ